jgi:hypothetical protein
MNDEKIIDEFLESMTSHDHTTDDHHTDHSCNHYSVPAVLVLVLEMVSVVVLALMR